MPHLNTALTPHVGPVPLPGGHSYLQYTDAAYLVTVRAAMDIIRTKITGYAPCNNAFKALPGGRTLAQIWADPAVWINFDPSTVAGNYAATRIKDVTITAFTLKQGRWTTAATLVHELAHVGGAPGGGERARRADSPAVSARSAAPTRLGRRAHPRETHQCGVIPR